MLLYLLFYCRCQIQEIVFVIAILLLLYLDWTNHQILFPILGLLLAIFYFFVSILLLWVVVSKPSLRLVLDQEHCLRPLLVWKTNSPHTEPVLSNHLLLFDIFSQICPSLANVLQQDVNEMFL